MGRGEIRIDGCVYSTLTLDNIPKRFMPEAKKPSPINVRRLTIFQKCRRKSENVIMVGPSLQKTPYGLGFFSIYSFLSNFHKCDIIHRNQRYSCLEQGYQCIKARLNNDEDAYQYILNATQPSDMKRRGDRIVTNEAWEKIKLDVMEELVFCKFKQNKILYNCLMNTRHHNLIECTLDEFWGTGCIFGGVALEDGSWTGHNYLGKILVRVRTQLSIELENRGK